MSIFKFVPARFGLAPSSMHNKTAMILEGSIERSGAGRQRWKTTALASAAVLALLGVSLDAQALALGAVTVRSALGEPLRAEIEVPQISSEEASSFQASVASPQAFRAAGVEYTQALAGARVTLHRRANGEAYLRVAGDRPINEPFLGVVIQANWAGGSIVRDYTMLVDPPGRAAPPPVAVTQPQATPPVVQAPAREARRPAPQPAEAAAPAARRAAPAAPAPSGDGAQVTVQRGNTAYGIVSAHAAEGVSLDQMLIALLRANPHAFIGGNVNRMRSGVVLNMPTAEQASAVSRQAARRQVVAQARDFNAYRRGVAQNVRDTPVASAGRTASGGVQAQVQESRAPAPSQDRLTLSRGGSPTGAEAATAQSRQAQEQAERAKELDRTQKELAGLHAQLGAASAASASAPAVAPASSPAAAINLPVGAPASAPAAEAAAAAPAMAAAPASDAASAAEAAATAASDAASAAATAGEAAASAAEAAASAPTEIASAPTIVPAPVPAPPPPPVAEPSFLDSLTENPLLPIAGAGLLALLAGYGIYRSRQRKKEAAPLDSSFIESRLQPDSFFGASGGQRVNTRESTTGTGNSSMAYSPSQLDAAGDVDPVAEADVYLAYGRDMQAEEILKEALRTHAGRIAIHRKLSEIYAKRRDVRALESIAVEAYEVTGGEGPDWLAITALGSELDPDNQLYKPGGAPVARTAPVPARGSFGADTEPQTAQLLDKKRSGSVRLDVNLNLDDAPVRGAGPAAGAAAAAAAAATASGPMSAPVDLDLDLGLDKAPLRASDAAPLSSAPASRPVDLDLDMDFAPPSELGPETRPPLAAAPAASKAGDNSGMIEFDMAALSIDPDSRSGGELNTEQSPDADDDPLGTKLALAQEFHAIGDTEGARSLVKEVIAEASGSLKARAERFLAELG